MVAAEFPLNPNTFLNQRSMYRIGRIHRDLAHDAELIRLHPLSFPRQL